MTQLRRRFVLVSTLVIIGCSVGGCNGGDSPTNQDLGPGLFVNECPSPSGPGTEHQGTISASETWTAAASPHVVTFDVDVRGATLTLEPCAVVRVKKGYGISIGENNGAAASLVAKGTSTNPIVVTSFDAAEHWGSLTVWASGTAQLEHAMLERGGDPAAFQGGGGALLLRGDDNRATSKPLVRANGLLIKDSATFGINARSSGGFTADSTDVTVAGAGAQGVVSGGVDRHYAVYIEAPGIATLPPGRYTGNSKDEILAATPFVLDADETFRDRGVPYQIVASFELSSPTAGVLRTLTIEAGVTLKVSSPDYVTPRVRLGSGNGGGGVSPVRLVAQGTAAKPILITSGRPAPAAGDWASIDWSGAPATGNVMSHVTVEYGGANSTTTGFGCGPSDNDSLLLITHWRPDDAFITDSTFRHSAGGAIVSGWQSDQSGPDFKATNTFSDIANGCLVSKNASMDGACPGNHDVSNCY